MVAWPVRLRELAAAEVDSAIDHYLAHAGRNVALRFVDAIEDAIGDVAAHPQTGTARFAHELDIAGLRALPVQGCPYLLFFVTRDDRVDVWRTLHTCRDLGDTLRRAGDDRGREDD